MAVYAADSDTVRSVFIFGRQAGFAAILPGCSASLLLSHWCGRLHAYVYGRETKADADIARVLTMDEARRIASNIAKLPLLLGKR